MRYPSLATLWMMLVLTLDGLSARAQPLLLHLPFDGHAQDATGRHAAAQVLGARLAPDRFGRPDAAYFFDGVDDFLQLDTLDLGGPAPWEALTVMCWLQLDRFKTGFLLASNTACTYSDDDFLNLALTYVHDYQDFYGQLMGRSPNVFFSDTDARDRAWHHLALVYDRGESRLYFDGQLAASEQTPYPVTDYQHQPQLGLTIGAATHNACPFNSHFSGRIDDVRIYGAALSPAQIAQLADGEATAAALLFPNAISPNGDTHNDTFKPLHIGAGVTIQALSIYNRWGQRLHHRTKPPFNWDGYIGGTRTPRDTYIYKAIIAHPDGRTEILSGELLVL